MVGYAPLVWPAVVVRCVLVRIVETGPEVRSIRPEVTLAASMPLPPVFCGGGTLVAAYVLCGVAGGGTLVAAYVLCGAAAGGTLVRGGAAAVSGGAAAGGGVVNGWPVPNGWLVLCPVPGR